MAGRNRGTSLAAFESPISDTSFHFTGADLTHSNANAEINALLGSALDCLSRNKLIEAEEILRRVLALDPDRPDGLHFFGILLAKTGRLPDALTWVERSLSLVPTDVMYLNNYADLLMRSGKLEQAIAALQSAITLGSEQVVTYVALARAFAATGQVDAALSAYRQSAILAAAPDWVPDEAAEYASRSGRHDISLTLLRQRLSRYGAGPQTWLGIGNALRELGDHAGAIDSWKQGLARDPNDSASRQSLYMMYQYLADWESSSRLMQTTFQGIRGSLAISVNPSMLLPFTDDPEIQLVCAKRWTSRYESNTAVSGIRGQRRQKIRVGYLSNDFCNHATMQLLVRTIELHDRDRFELLAYSWSPDDGTDIPSSTDKFVSH
jgi:protein O-GlcNAc transferase